MRAPVRSSLANRGAEPSRQARESVYLMLGKLKTVLLKWLHVLSYGQAVERFRVYLFTIKVSFM